MRSRIVPFTLLAIIIAGIIVGAIYYQSQKERGLAPETPPPTATLTSTAAPTPGASVSPGPAVSVSPSPGSLSPGGPEVSKEKPVSNPNPDLTVDANGLSKATVVMTTTQGVIKFKFYPKDAPNTVHRIIELINSGFYNGLTFHRVVPNFVVQGGDPQGNGTGGSGQKLKAEFNSRRHVEGTVAMARAADPDSADSQFYITLSPQPHLDRSYTVFGQVIEGMDVVRKLQVGDKMTSLIIE